MNDVVCLVSRNLFSFETDTPQDLTSRSMHASSRTCTLRVPSGLKIQDYSGRSIVRLVFPVPGSSASDAEPVVNLLGRSRLHRLEGIQPSIA